MYLGLTQACPKLMYFILGVSIVAKCPGLAGTVPEFGLCWLCPGLSDFIALSQSPAQLHK